MRCEYRQLGDVAIQFIDGDRGKNYPSNNEFSNVGYCLFLNAKNVTPDGFSFGEVSFITQKKDAMLRKGKLEKNDVVLTTRGTVGNVAFYGERVLYSNVRINSGMLIIRPDPSVFCPEYVYWLFRSDVIQDQIKRFSSGTAQPQLPISSIKKFEIPLVDIKTQKEIAAILSALDEKIATNRAINENLEQQAASLYFSMFVSYDYYANMEFEDSEFGRIPKGWQVLSLDDVTINIRDRVHNNNYRVLSALNSGILQPSDEYFTKQVFSKDISNYIIVAENDFAYNPARVNIGSLGINDLGYTGCVSPVYVVFRTENNYQNFMRFFVKSKRFQEEVKTRASGSVRQAMNYADFSLIRLVYPPKSAIDEFNDMVESIWKNIKHLRQENEKLSELRDSLLPKLMSGEIDVSAVQF